jgi:hypothetical protein
MIFFYGDSMKKLKASGDFHLLIKVNDLILYTGIKI